MSHARLFLYYHASMSTPRNSVVSCPLRFLAKLPKPTENRHVFLTMCIERLKFCHIGRCNAQTNMNVLVFCWFGLHFLVVKGVMLRSLKCTVAHRSSPRLLRLFPIPQYAVEWMLDKYKRPKRFQCGIYIPRICILQACNLRGVGGGHRNQQANKQVQETFSFHSSSKELSFCNKYTYSFPLLLGSLSSLAHSFRHGHCCNCPRFQIPSVTKIK